MDIGTPVVWLVGMELTIHYTDQHDELVFSDASAPRQCQVHGSDDTVRSLQVGGHADGLQEHSHNAPGGDEHSTEEVY